MVFSHVFMTIQLYVFSWFLKGPFAPFLVLGLLRNRPAKRERESERASESERESESERVRERVREEREGGEREAERAIDRETEVTTHAESDL